MFFPILAWTLVSATTMTQPAGQTQPQGKYQELASQLLDGLQAGKFDVVESNFDATMQAGLPSDKLRAVWAQVTGQVGQYEGMDAASVQDVRSYHVVTAVCRFDSAKLDATISFDSAGHTSGMFFKSHNEPAPRVELPTGLKEKSVVVGEGGKWPLPGTLTLPPGTGPFAAIVLVHGSGPTDRDETIGPNKPFRDMAWGLAQQGIAVLRYEKRTKQYGAQLAASPGNFTVDDETVDDAVLAVSLLEHEPEIDKSRIFVLGHSLGGTMIPRIAIRTPQAAGYVILAGATEPIEKLILEQYKARLAGQTTPGALATLKSVQSAVAKIDGPTLTESTPASEIMGVPGSYWLDLREYEPAVEARKIRKPLLIMQGASDIQVPLRDFETWKSELGAAGLTTYKLYPGLSHLFMPDQLTPDSYMTPNHVDAGMIGDIAQWIKGVHK